MYESKPQPETAQAFCDSLGIDYSAEFVPQSQSRLTNTSSRPTLLIGGRFKMKVNGYELRPYANLRSANLQNAKGLEQQCILPEGDITGWKKVSDVLVELKIPAHAKRVNAYGSRKCRAEFAEVIAGNATSDGYYGPATEYKAGEIVRPDSFDPDPRIECSNGIHFFITRKEAESWS